MNRYRTYAPNDDPPIESGDGFLIGVNSYDSPSNLPEGVCQAAINMDFTQAQAVSRGGFVCLPTLGISSFNNSSPWTARTSAANKTWFGVAYGNGRFVAVANNASGTNDVMVSADGVSWTAISTGFSNQWYAITYGGGLFVAVAESGTGNRVMTSPDGVTWTQRTSAADNNWHAICYGNGLFVSVASNGTTNQAMTSPDGITWTLRTTPTATSGFDWRGITYGGGLYVAVNGQGATVYSVMTSPDGITWTERSAVVNTFSGVAYGRNRFVAVATGGSAIQAMTSDDGLTWTQRSTIAGSFSWEEIAFGSNVFTAVNSTGTAASAVMTSPDGVTWASASAPTTQSWYSVAYGNGTFVAVPSASSAALMTKSYYSTPNVTGAVLGSGNYSDPNSISTPWIVLVGTTQAGFYSFGQTARTVAYPNGVTISKQSTVVQANNFLFIFPGTGQTPLRWNGDWSQAFITAPASTLGVGYTDIPQSNQGTYYQNRLWVINGKDTVSASQALDFQNFNVLTSVFNLNVGTSDFVVCSYPFGDNSLIVFKNKSIYLLQSVDGALTDVTSTEITRQLGIIGINAVTAVGPDIVYMSSDRNITSIQLNIQNKTQAVTVPISRDINPIMKRVNWSYGYKVALGYWNNLLFVSLPLDNSTVCNSVIVYNFITKQWYGEWNFSSTIGMSIQGWVTANYLGQIRMHAITEDGRIFVVDEGQNDISGTTVAEISTSLTTRAYPMNNDNRYNRRMYADFATNRPNFSVTGYVDGISESSAILSGQTYSRSNSWIFNDSTYDLTNANDDYNRAFRQDYSTGPNSIQCGTGFQPEAMQEFRLPLIFRRNGRLVWFNITNTTGKILLNGIGAEARPGLRGNQTQVG